MSDHPGAPGASDGPSGPTAHSTRLCHRRDRSSGPGRRGPTMSDPSQGTDRRRSPRRLTTLLSVPAGGRCSRTAAPSRQRRSPKRRRLDRKHPLDASRQPRFPSPPMAFAMPLGDRDAGRSLPRLRRGGRNRPEMNRRIRTAHGLGDALPFDAPFSRMSHGRLLAKALQRQSGRRSCGSGSAPAVARSGRVTRRQRLAPLRADASSPDARTGVTPFLRPREPTLIRPLGRPASRQQVSRLRHFTGATCPPPLQGQRQSVRLTSRPQSTPIAAIARLRVKRNR
jgi:hypothetical protein